MGITKEAIKVLDYIYSMKGNCSWVGCTEKATRFERWSASDFSISCKDHHSNPEL